EDLTSALSVPLWAYAVGLGLALANYLAGSVRLMLLARLDGDALAFGKALRAYSLGLFSPAITPGSAGQAPAMVPSPVAAAARPSCTRLRSSSRGLCSAAITPGSAGQAPAMVLSLVADGVRASAAWSMAVRVWISDLIFLALTLPLSVLLLARSTRLLRGY